MAMEPTGFRVVGSPPIYNRPRAPSRARASYFSAPASGCVAATARLRPLRLAV